MDYDRLKGELREMVSVTENVPEPYRVKLFEILLNNYLTGAAERAAGASNGAVTTDGASSRVRNQTLTVPTQVRVFMQRTGVTAEELASVVLHDDGQLHFLREPRSVSIAQGQIEWALLVALKNGFENDSLSTDPEAVRSVCQEKGFYDKANFASNFKTARSAKLFKRPLEPQGQPQSLTVDGQHALAKLIKTLAAAT